MNYGAQIVSCVFRRPEDFAGTEDALVEIMYMSQVGAQINHELKDALVEFASVAEEQEIV